MWDQELKLENSPQVESRQKGSKEGMSDVDGAPQKGFTVACVPMQCDSSLGLAAGKIFPCCTTRAWLLVMLRRCLVSPLACPTRFNFALRPAL